MTEGTQSPWNTKDLRYNYKISFLSQSQQRNTKTGKKNSTVKFDSSGISF